MFSCYKVVQYKQRCSELELLIEQQRNDVERVRHTVSVYRMRKIHDYYEFNIGS